MSNLTMLDGNRGVGKSNVFGDGEWSGEPDLLEFEAYGFKCEAKRHDSMGHLCGYITVGADHPWHALTYDEVDADVHGGLTFSEDGKHGFDCAHSGDLIPKLNHLANNYSGDVYRGMGYVVGELIKLAKQAKEASDES